MRTWYRTYFHTLYDEKKKKEAYQVFVTCYELYNKDSIYERSFVSPIVLLVVPQCTVFTINAVCEMDI